MDKIDDQLILQMLMKPETQRRGFEACVRQYGEQLYWQVRKIVLTHDDANDVLQNSFLKAWNGLSSFQGDSKVLTWLSRIAINESLDFLRRNKQRQTVSDADPSVAGALLADNYFDLQLGLGEVVPLLNNGTADLLDSVLLTINQHHKKPMLPNQRGFQASS